MRTVLALALIVPLAGCGAIKAPDLSGFSQRDDAWPETRPLTAPLRPVAAPSRRHLSTMSVVSLKNGRERRLRVRRYGAGHRVRESGGCVWTRDMDWFSPSDSWANCGSSDDWRAAQAQVRREGSLYPLRVGSTGAYTRRARSSSTGEISTRRTVCAVEKTETVLRPGGAATPAYVVVCEDGRLRRTTWFSPKEGPVAYREEHLKRGVREAWVRRS